MVLPVVSVCSSPSQRTPPRHQQSSLATAALSVATLLPTLSLTTATLAAAAARDGNVGAHADGQW